MDPRTKAGEQDHESGEEQQDHSSENCPDARTELCMRARAILVNVVLDNAKEGEITSQSYDDDDKRDRGCDDTEDSATDTGPKSEEEGNKGESGSNRVKNHHTGEGLGGVNRGRVECSVVDALHNVRRIVSNVLSGAVILIGASRSYI